MPAIVAMVTMNPLLVCKTLASLSKIKDAATSKDFKAEANIADDGKWSARVKEAQGAIEALL